MRAVSSWTRSSTLVLSAAAALTVAAPPVAAQESAASREVIQLLSRTVPVMADVGFDLRRTVTGAMNNQRYRDVRVTLVAGVTYRFVGVCDDDCDDLDLQLFDAAGNEVTSDLAPDDTPLLELTARHSQTYTLRVIMASCNDDPCSFGVGVYGDQSGAAASATPQLNGWTAAEPIRQLRYV